MLSNKYKITGIINHGTFSTLYEGIHIHKNQKVAIKLESDPISKKLLNHEIEMYLYLKKHKHIHIPKIKCIGIFEEYSYIVMELLDINLKQHVKNGVSKLDFIYLIEQIITLMSDFHDRNLCHRDIKPENFVLDKHKTLCIVDLGLSCHRSNRELMHFIGNKRYASYTCHLSTYTYTKEDDLRSVVYMLLDLYTNTLPWDNYPNPTYKIKKEADFINFYKSKQLYDQVIDVILAIHERIGHKYFYRDILAELGCTIDYGES